ncbi:MAG TPA: ATP-binding cassette domain-containing protein, partial [Cryobacterium sp.]|nr:ATP-binding cassette domain-containing protein [Cryobacterium sp.]
RVVLGHHDSKVCVVVAEHNTREWVSRADAWLEIRGNRLCSLRPGQRPSLAGAAAQPAARRVTASAQGGPLAGIRHITVSHGENRAVDDVSLEISAGDIIALEGRNGAGKTSLLGAMALPATRGSVLIGGLDVSLLRPLARRQAVALVPEYVDDLLFATSVAEECRRADRRSGHGSARATAGTFLNLLGRGAQADAGHLMQRHPRDLSAGERLCLVMAIQLAAAPSLLLVDEPTRGLDPQARALVGAALLRASNHASAVMFATHDHDFARSFATKAILMDAGRAAPGPVAVAT